jgi:hypothetical protein
MLDNTEKIDADKTAQEIARCVSMHGAQAVLTEYDEKDGYVTAISFKITMDGKPLGFRLPCDWKPVLEIFKNDPKVPQHMVDRVQAVRVAWRIGHGSKGSSPLLAIEAKISRGEDKIRS